MDRATIGHAKPFEHRFDVVFFADEQLFLWPIAEDIETQEVGYRPTV
jgi:hypothetical protein